MLKKSIKNKINHIIICYSSVFGTSTSYANKLHKQFDKNSITSILLRIDKLPLHQLTLFKGTIIFILSTTGNGDCPQYALQFLNYIKNLQLNNINLSNLKIVNLGLGSTIYPNFNKFSIQVNRIFKKLGSQQILQMQLCDSSIKTENNTLNSYQNKQLINQNYSINNTKSFYHMINKIYPTWKNKLIKTIIQFQYLNKINNINNINSNYSQFFNIQINNRQRAIIIQQFFLQKLTKLNIKSSKIQQELQKYKLLKEVQVLSYQQLRKNNQQNQKRSTILVTMKKPSQFQFYPACNINIYPQNIQKQINQLLYYLHNKIQTPSINQINFKQFLKISNFNKKATRQIINSAFSHSTLIQNLNRQNALIFYKQMIKNKNLSCKQLIKQIKPEGNQFFSHFQCHAPRPYTLCSWKNNAQTIQIAISLTEGGVTSQFIKNNPNKLRISCLKSSFNLPQNNNPILMISNGVGITPFRSICQYYYEKKINNQITPELQLFFGIQNENVDFYFRQQWEQYKNIGLIKIKLAQSRTNPQQGEYVQNLIEKKQIINHLINKKGYIYICGTQAMAESVENILIDSLILQNNQSQQIGKQYYLALKKSMKIVYQVFN